jgi:glycosyltransferase involved in cell wall biosynthesis
MALAHGLTQLFVVPSADALPTGGNLYNEGLLAALAAQGESFVRASLEQLDQVAGPFARVWIDSLYLAQWSALRARLVPSPSGRELGRGQSPSGASSFALLLHALPSDLARAEGTDPAPWLALEAEALAAFDTAVTTSITSAEQLARRAPHLRAWAIAPAVQCVEAGSRGAQGWLQALVVGNLTPNKGLLPWLRALAPRLRDDDAFTLRCIGRADLDPPYARACAELVRDDDRLATRVVLAGGQAPAEVSARLARAQLLVSPSRHESFGMAIADARASGCVVLARHGGHTARLVEAAAGGALCADDDTLVAAFLRCVRDRAELAERLRRAHTLRLAPRDYRDAAREFMAHARAGAARNAQ